MDRSDRTSYLTEYEQFISGMVRKKPMYFIDNSQTNETPTVKNVATENSAIAPDPLEIYPREVKSKKRKYKNVYTKRVYATPSKAVQNEPPSEFILDETEQYPIIRSKLLEKKTEESMEKDSDDIFTEELLTLQDEPIITAYECQICSFETIYDSAFKEHMLTHSAEENTETESSTINEPMIVYSLANDTEAEKNTLEELPHSPPKQMKKTKKETFHKCPRPNCLFKMKCKAVVKKHMALDQQLPGHWVYCGLYSYSDRCKVDLDLHLLVHESEGQNVEAHYSGS